MSNYKDEIKDLTSDKLGKRWVVVNETKDYVMLEKPKRFNWLVFSILFVFGFFGIFFYLLYYVGEGPKKKTIAKA